MEETKKCPYCGEEILAAAKKCKHCGEWLEETKPVVEEREKAVSNEYSKVENDSKPDQEEKGIFKHYFWDVIKNHYVDFQRTASRKEYWLFALCYYLLSIALLCFYFVSVTMAGIIYIVFAFGIILPSLAISVARLRDINKSWANLFLSLIPLVGVVILLVYFCREGEKKNKKVKMAVADYVIIALAVLGCLAPFYQLGQAEDSDIDYESLLLSELSKDISDNDALGEDDVCIATWKRKGNNYSYLLRKDGENYDGTPRYETVLYIMNHKTKEKRKADLSDFYCVGGEEASCTVIADYIVKGEKIVFICGNMCNGCDVFYYDMSDDTFNYIDCGRDAEFVNDNQVIVSRITDYVAGDCAANSYYETEDVTYNL